MELTFKRVLFLNSPLAILFFLFSASENKLFQIVKSIKKKSLQIAT